MIIKKQILIFTMLAAGSSMGYSNAEYGNLFFQGKAQLKTETASEMAKRFPSSKDIREKWDKAMKNRTAPFLTEQIKYDENKRKAYLKATEERESFLTSSPP